MLIDLDNSLDSIKVELSDKKIKIKLVNGQIVFANRKLIKQISGTQQIIKKSLVYEFLGVPFAQPPLGDKRFQFPHNLTNALPTNVYDATSFRDSCMQELDTSLGEFPGATMWNAPDKVSEDCLYMNLWVSVTFEQDKRFREESEKNLYSDMDYLGFSKYNTNFRQLTSLFWIYGGSFSSGSANLKVYDGTIMAGLEDIVVITANYRTGPFGFLYLNNEGAPGNAGLADQILAIQWFKEYYLPLFGEPNTSNMVLFGESAGAMSIHDLLLSEKSYLFSRAILQSSSSYSDLTYRKPSEALKVSLRLAELVGCNESSSLTSGAAADYPFAEKSIIKISDNLKGRPDDARNQRVLDCLMRVDASSLSLNQFNIEYVNKYLPMQFVPTADYHQLVPIDPTEYYFSVTSRKFKQEILAGINQDEGTYFAFYEYKDIYFNLTHMFDGKFDNKFVADRLYESLKTKYPFDNDNILFDSNGVSPQLVNEYYYEQLTSCIADTYTRTGRMVSGSEHIDFDLDTEENRRLNSPELAWRKFCKIIGDIIFACPTINLANKYSEKNPEKTFFYKFNKRANSNPWPKWAGVMHGYELEYLFGMPWLNKEQFDYDDRVLSRKMINFWANFAKYGKL